MNIGIVGNDMANGWITVTITSTDRGIIRTNISSTYFIITFIIILIIIIIIIITTIIITEVTW